MFFFTETERTVAQSKLPKAIVRASGTGDSMLQSAKRHVFELQRSEIAALKYLEKKKSHVIHGLVKVLSINNRRLSR